MKGDFVVVRTYEGPLVRRVWDAGGNVVSITTSENLELLASGRDALRPVGFRREDVFEYEPSLDAALAAGSLDWKQLQPY